MKKFFLFISKITLIFFLNLVCLAVQVYPSGKTAIFRFLKECYSPRELSLGSVNTFFEPDGFSSLQNPSVMSLASRRELTFLGGSRLASIGGATGGAAGILYLDKGEKRRSAGFNFTYDGSIQERTLAPISPDRYDFTAEGSFATYALVGGGYYSFKLPVESSPGDYGYYSGQTYFGIGAKLIIEKLYTRSYPGIAFDAALLEESDENTAFSIGIKNLGASLTSTQDGISYQLPTSGFLTILKRYKVISFALDAEYDAQGFGDVKMGVETNFSKSFAFRIGFRHPFSEEDVGDFFLSRISAGFGIILGSKNKMSFDYAWHPRGDLGSAHIIALRSYL